MAEEGRKDEFVNYLTERKQKYNIRDHLGRTIPHGAVERNHPLITE